MICSSYTHILHELVCRRNFSYGDPLRNLHSSDADFFRMAKICEILYQLDQQIYPDLYFHKLIHLMPVNYFIETEWLINAAIKEAIVGSENILSYMFKVLCTNPNLSWLMVH